MTPDERKSLFLLGEITNNNNNNDALFQRVGPSIRSGPTFCPRITIVESQEILVSSGTNKGIKVKVDNIAVSKGLRQDTETLRSM